MGKISNQDCEAIVVSPYWPTHGSGANIAARASLLAYLQVFSKIHYIWVADEKWGAGKGYPGTEADRLAEWKEYNIDFHNIAFQSQPRWLRFLKSIFSHSPAITVQFMEISGELALKVDEIVRCGIRRKSKYGLIFEDMPSACCISRIRRKVPELSIAIRSHNVAAQIFEEFSDTGNWIKNVLWKYEIRKIFRFEKKICDSADKVWVISPDDAREYREKLSIEVDGEVGACLDTAKYINMEFGAPYTVISVGRIDLRKGQGWDTFIENVWPGVREKIPNAKLVIAGSGSKKYQDTLHGIEGMGFVEDDREVLARGQIFINPQNSGSGIKIKSIVAMLSGKVLVSTRTGLQGVTGRHGEHFLMAENQSDFVEHICRLMTNANEVVRLSDNARKIAVATYGLANFLKNTTPVVEAFRATLGG